jgi:hypothetical protein
VTSAEASEDTARRKAWRIACCSRPQLHIVEHGRRAPRRGAVPERREIPGWPVAAPAWQAAIARRCAPPMVISDAYVAT